MEMPSPKSSLGAEKERIIGEEFILITLGRGVKPKSPRFSRKRRQYGAIVAYSIDKLTKLNLDVWKRNPHLSSKGEIWNVGEEFGCWHVLEVLLMCASCAWFARESVHPST
ncbi:hypothetical protein AVEN_180223-1 [Araneus ventricosus]|uniref:Uncharacterized protein n=1 Tax=Araneus ventricosus TaxID=182803 RepID=A0A4Y2N1A1_ARAVE|nr:hypothetical protein AVEN_180223-1 [Araneus ventricosus]